MLSPGNGSDFTQAPVLLNNLPAGVKQVLGDRGYDSYAIEELLDLKGVKAIIPSRKTNRRQREIPPRVYARRNRIERFFAWLKKFRRIATRYDKLDACFLGFIHLAFILRWVS